MSSEFESIFARLRGILQRHGETLRVKEDTRSSYILEGETGPATLQAWGGKMKKPTVPVAWVQVGKNYVSYHLMGIYVNPALHDGVSKALEARMQGKACFNFRCYDEDLFEELEKLTVQAIGGFQKAGFVRALAAV